MSVPPSETVCLYFARGDCQYGDKCIFKHVENAKEQVPFCMYFNSAGGCRYGDECRYRHETEAKVAEPAAPTWRKEKEKAKPSKSSKSCKLTCECGAVINTKTESYCPFCNKSV